VGPKWVFAARPDGVEIITIGLITVLFVVFAVAVIRIITAIVAMFK
jgi:hypothetical protein